MRRADNRCHEGLPFQDEASLEALPFKGVRAVCLRGIAARTDRTTGALRRAGRFGCGWGSVRAGFDNDATDRKPAPTPALPLRERETSSPAPAAAHGYNARP
jgi:hypothetical protein